MSEKQIGAAIAIVGTLGAGVLADLGCVWTASACFIVAIGSVVCCAPEL